MSAGPSRLHVYACACVLAFACLCAGCGGGEFTYNPAALPEQVRFDVGRMEAEFRERKYDGTSGIKLELSDYSVALTDSAAYAVGCVYFPVLLDAQGDTVFHPRMLPPRTGPETQARQESFFDNWNDPTTLSFFIPVRHLRLPPGEHQLSYLLMVTDDSLKAKFPPLTQGKVTVRQPRLFDYQLDLRHGKYAIQSADGTPGTNLRWELKIGHDLVYESPIARRSDTLLPARPQFRFAEGDVVSLDIVDLQLTALGFQKGRRLAYFEFDLGADGREIQLQDSTHEQMRHLTFVLKPVK